jgi:uncharacterized protein (TIGR00255 family)
MRSMTGFGRAAGEGGGYRVVAEARSVNHRHLEVVVRAREPYRALEGRLRALVAERVSRGRVELAVETEPLDEPSGAPRLRRRVLLALAEQVHELAAARPDLGLGPATWGDLLRVADLVEVPLGERVLPVEAEGALLAVAASAVDSMVEAREREGEALAAALDRLSAELRELVEGVAAELPVWRARLAERASSRLSELLRGLDPTPMSLADPSAWLPEALALAERSDVTEELERLRAHLDHFEETCQGSEPAGRRLDFLTQELLREAQTLGAKCRALPLAQRILEAKLVAERMREQVQNVE